jgi:hypothetical protein
MTSIAVWMCIKLDRAPMGARFWATGDTGKPSDSDYTWRNRRRMT